MCERMEKLKEECGVFGIFDRKNEHNVNGAVYSALYALQHRGQESCGIAVCEEGNISYHRDLGLVNEVFTPEMMARLPQNGQMAIGHCRYAPAGKPRRSDAQPMYIRHINGSMALAFNGALTNGAKLRKRFEMEGGIFHTTTDAEAIAYTIINQRLKHDSLEAAVSAAMEELEGAYSIVVMNHEKMVAVRDPHGFRPLCLGKSGEADLIASESCAVDAIDGAFVRDIKPGEIVVIDSEGVHSDESHCGQEGGLCVFEYVYFARPDSVIDGASVHLARRRAGAFLALEHPVQADVVIGAPDSGLDAALGYAQQSGIPYGIGFLKNKYIGRTFIQPNQKQRENTVRIKLNPIAATVKGKRVVLVDDSIVRGTTSLKIVKLLREAGATEVHFRASSPAFLYPCYFGTDVPRREDLIAVNNTVEEIAREIGVDSLGFLSVESVKKIAGGCTCGLCTGCFTGEYPVPAPKQEDVNQ
ncbi:MAG: amidophosphoribosyltransferase [Oscillospiraceae bacterium]|nr:amidophosphoribosyltransferase [Oscillospiraceae bacterium]